MARIAVIGAGLGALAAAARLAVAGHEVAVFERSGTHGGAVGRYARDGFAFDTGPGLLHLPAVYRDLFLKTGREPLESRVEMTAVDPAVRHLFADGTDVRLPNASRAGTVAALDTALGAGAGERWSELLVRARTAWDAMRRPLLEEPLWADWPVLRRDPYPAPRRRGLLGRSRTPATLAAVARAELRDPRLVALLESHAVAHGLDPRTAPACAAVLPYMEQTFGSWYPRGGMRALADAVYERCLERGVAFTFDAEVASILREDGRVAGLGLAGGGTVRADTVVAGIAPDRVVPLLDGERPWRESDVRPAEDLPRTGRLTVFAALRGPRPAGTPHRSVVHAPDRGGELDAVFSPGSAPGTVQPTVTVLRPDDPATRPDDGHEAVTLQATVPLDGVDWRDGAVVADAVRRVTRAASAAVPDLRERLLWQEAAAPGSSGPLPHPALAGGDGRLLLPGNRTRVPGLYLAGGWSHPGGGPAHAGMSGALVAGLITRGEDWRGSR